MHLYLTLNKRVDDVELGTFFRDQTSLGHVSVNNRTVEQIPLVAFQGRNFVGCTRKNFFTGWMAFLSPNQQSINALINKPRLLLTKLKSNYSVSATVTLFASTITNKPDKLLVRTSTELKPQVHKDTYTEDDNVDRSMTIDIGEDGERSVMSKTLEQVKSNEQQQTTGNGLQHLITSIIITQ